MNNNRYINLLSEKRLGGGIIVAIGPPRSGKTYNVYAAAANKLMTNQVCKVIVAQDPKLSKKKLEVYEAFNEQGCTPRALDRMISLGEVDIISMHDFKHKFSNCFVIAEHGTTYSPDHIKNMLLHAGENNTIVLTSSMCPGSGIIDLMDRVDRLFETSDEFPLDLVMLTPHVTTTTTKNSISQSPDFSGKMSKLYAL